MRPMRTRRAKGLWIVAALLAVNATLLVAQPGLALPGSLGNYFFGPKLVRAEVLVKDGGVLHDYRVDRGTIRNKAGGTLTCSSATAASSGSRWRLAPRSRSTAGPPRTQSSGAVWSRP